MLTQKIRNGFVINLSGAEAKQGFFEAIADSVSNMVVISASSPHQVNKQVIINNEELGSLSYSFYKALNEMTAGNTYELLFEKIRATMQAFIPEQIPMIEGNGQQIIFNGKYKAREDKIYIRVGYKESAAALKTLYLWLKKACWIILQMEPGVKYIKQKAKKFIQCCYKKS